VAESCVQVLAMTNSSWPLRAFNSANSAEQEVPSDASARHTQKNTTSAARIEARRLVNRTAEQSLAIHVADGLAGHCILGGFVSLTGIASPQAFGIIKIGAKAR
jgi:hypothetical protein